ARRRSAPSPRTLPRSRQACRLLDSLSSLDGPHQLQSARAAKLIAQTVRPVKRANSDVSRISTSGQTTLAGVGVATVEPWHIAPGVAHRARRCESLRRAAALLVRDRQAAPATATIATPAATSLPRP